MAFELFKGIEWTWRGTITDDDTGDRTDLTGKAVTLEVRYRANEDPVISLSIGSGVTLLAQSGATVGQADFVISAVASENLPARNHRLVVKVDDEIVLGPVKLPVRII